MHEMKKERIEYLDILKGIGIFLVAYEHVSMLPKNSVFGNILMCISYGAVPCFMMVTGGLMSRSKEMNWKKYIFRLIKMYLLLCFWKVVYLVFYMKLNTLSFSKTELFRYVFLFETLPDVNSGLLWYLEAYLAVMVLYPVTWFLFKGGRNGRITLAFWGSLVFISSLGVIGCNSFLGENSVQTVVPYMAYGNMFFYYILGAFLLEYRERIHGFISGKTPSFNGKKFPAEYIRKHGKLIPAVLLAGGTLGLLGLKYLDTRSICWEQVHVSNAYYRISTILLSVGIYLTVMEIGFYIQDVSCVQSRIKRKSGRYFCAFFQMIGEIFGKTTMGIYLLHGLLVPCLQVYVSTHPSITLSLGLHVFVTLLTVLACSFVTKILQKIPMLREVFV